MLQFLVFAIVYPIITLLSYLPFKVLYWVSDFIYLIFFYLIGYRKKVVLQNLKTAFPEKSEEELRAIRKEFYHHFIDVFLEMTKTNTLTKNEMSKRMYLTNKTEFTQFIKDHPNTVLLTSHHANYEWLVSLNMYLENSAFGAYKKVKNKYLDRYIVKTRSRFNCKLVGTKDFFNCIENNYQSNVDGLYALISDQSPKRTKTHHFSDFLNNKVAVYTSGEFMAKKYNYPLVILRNKKIKRGFYEATFEVITTDPRKFPDYQLTDIFMQRLEEQVREQPPYYFWTHKRFKHLD